MRYLNINFISLIVFLCVNNSCRQSEIKTTVCVTVKDGIKKVTTNYSDRPNVDYVEEFSDYGELLAEYILVNDTLDGLEYSYNNISCIKSEVMYDMGVKHGVSKNSIDNSFFSSEGLLINDSCVFSKNAYIVRDNQSNTCLKYCLYKLENVNEDGSVIVGFLRLFDDNYVDIFNLKNGSIDWQRSSWFYDDLKDTIVNNITRHFTLSSNYYQLPDSLHYLQTILMLGPIDTKRELTHVNDEFKSEIGEKEIECHIRFTEKGYQLLTGKIVVHCIGEASKDTLLISNLFYKQVYVE